MKKATIRQLREAAGLTQAELARRVGVQTSQVSRWERGVAVPTARNARRLGRRLGVSPDDLESGHHLT
ncbi:MAG: helix-turn-helix transcriptional regulator [Candidatus Dormiibacterota bacterium]